MSPETIPFLGFSDPLSSWTHLLAALAALVVGLILMRKGRGNTPRMISLGVFTFTMVFLFSMSGVFHLLDHDGDARAVLRRLDHAAIWTMIAGTFTPIHVILFRGAWRWGVLVGVWTVAITALTLEVIFFDSIPEWLILSLFLGLGWFGFFSFTHFRRQYDHPSVKFLVLGGLAYSIGAIIDFSKWPILIPGVLGPHEIFHLFVIAGAGFHACFVYHWAHHPVANKVTFQVKIFPDRHCEAIAISEPVRLQAKSVEELKIAIRARVREIYHDSIQPEIHLKYSNEEILV